MYLDAAMTKWEMLVKGEIQPVNGSGGLGVYEVPSCNWYFTLSTYCGSVLMSHVLL